MEIVRKSASLSDVQKSTEGGGALLVEVAPGARGIDHKVWVEMGHIGNFLL